MTPAAKPRLTDCDIILVNSSAGKDSQATLDLVAGAAREAGVLDRLVVAHTDLGDAEWDGVPNSPQSTQPTTAYDSRSPGVHTTEQLRRVPGAGCRCCCVRAGAASLVSKLAANAELASLVAGDAGLARVNPP